MKVKKRLDNVSKYKDVIRRLLNYSDRIWSMWSDDCMCEMGEYFPGDNRKCLSCERKDIYGLDIVKEIIEELKDGRKV